MTRPEVLELLTQRCGENLLSLQDRSTRRVFLEVRPPSLTEVAALLHRDLGCRFATASAVDHPGRIEILYHFVLDSLNLILSVVVQLDRSAPSIPSLTQVFAAAGFIEREIHELFGVEFPGHPDLRRLLLPDQWPPGVFPLRRDYVEWDPAAIRDGGNR